MISRIEPKVLKRCCPGCGHVVTQVEIVQSRFDFPCAGCQKHNWSEFVPLKETAK